MLVVDANIWVARFVPSELHHQQSRDWLRQTIRGGERLAAPELLLVEVSSAITRQLNDSARAAQVVQQLLKMRSFNWVNVDHGLILLAAEIAADLRLKSADAVYVAVAERLNVPLITWDDEIIKRASRRIVVRRPV
jgi:predicted nucleic acid-binding protein